jgi:hypothetical protein
MTARTSPSNRIEFRPVTIEARTIPAAALPKVIEKAAKVSRRLARYEVPAITVTASEPYEVTETTEVGWEFRRRVVDVTVTGFAAHIGDWTFVATIDHTLGAENLIAAAPDTGLDVPVEYRTATPVCDHCGTNRRRNSTVLLHHPEQGWRQVGRNCLVDYIDLDPATVVWLAEPREFCDYDDEAVRESVYVPVDIFVAVAEAATQAFGFVSRRQADEDYRRVATADVVTTALFDRGRPGSETRKALAEYAGALTPVSTIVEWLAAQDRSSDYIFNLGVAVNAGVAVRRTYGLLASLPAAYHRATAEKIEREQRPTGEYVGKVGDRVTVTGTVAQVISVETQFGTSRRVTVIDSDGNTWTTFGSGASLFDRTVAEGRTLTWTGTIKDHTEYRSIHQNVLARVKVAWQDDNNEKEITS